MLKLSPIIGHRGASGYAPENTIASMQKAQALGVKWVEVDLMLTQDKEIIIFHDETLGRTTDGEGLIKDTTLADIRKLDAGAWFAAEFKNEKVPTLEELINYLKIFNLNANLELKAHPGEEKEFAKILLPKLKQLWPSSLEPPLLSSFSYEMLQALHAEKSPYDMGWIISHWPEDWQKRLKDVGCVSLHCSSRLLQGNRVDEIKKIVPYVLSFTVNTDAEAKRLFSNKVDAIFTDFPDKISYSKS